MSIRPFLFFILFPSLLLSQGPPKVYFLAKGKIDTLQEAILSKNSALIVPSLDKTFSFQNQKGEKGIVALNDFIKKNNSILGIIYSNQMVAKGSLFEVPVIISVADSLMTGLIKFTSEAKIVELDLSDSVEILEEFKPSNSKTLNSSAPFRLEVPLFFSGHIYVKGIINGIEGYFELDTGTPLGWISSKYLQTKEDKKYVYQEKVNAQVIISGKSFDLTFAVDTNLERRFFSVETKIGMKVLGIIGTNLLLTHVIEYDFIHSQITIENIDVALPSPLGNTYESVWVDIQYGLQGHTFFKNCRIGNLFGLVHFDTGIWADELEF